MDVDAANAHKSRVRDRQWLYIGPILAAPIAHIGVTSYRHAKTPLQRRVVVGVGIVGATAVSIGMRLYLMAHAGYAGGNNADVVKGRVHLVTKEERDSIERPDALQAIKEVYFNIAGRAEKVRLALAVGGIPFDDDRVVYADWPEIKKSTPYGQLPLLYVDGKPMAQSLAMLRYVGRLAPALYPPEAQTDIDCAIELVSDFEQAWGPALYLALKPTEYGYPEGFNKTPEGAERIKAVRETFLRETLPKFAKFFADRIDQHGGAFLCGPELTIADCYLAPELKKFTMGFIDHVPVTSLDAYPAITAYLARFYAHPKVKAYYDSKK